jgi:hypothetical protein
VAVDKVTQEADEIDFYKANIKTVDHEDDLPEDSDSLIQTASNATNTYRAPSPGLAAQTGDLEMPARYVRYVRPRALRAKLREEGE